MEITGKMIEVGSEALLGCALGQALKLREHEARKIVEVVLRAEFDGRQVVPLILSAD